jgi:ankyrin repeat protein
VVETLIDLGADPNIPEYEFNGKMCPIHLAVEKNNYSIARLLLESKADPNVQNKNGATPLHIAAREGYAEVVELLVTYGADVNRRDKYGFTASYWAFENGHQKILTHLPKPSMITVKEECEFRDFAMAAHGHLITDMRKKKRGMKGMMKK